MLDSIASPTLWGVTIAAVVALLVIDFVATRKPHEVSMREAVAWSTFYVAPPLMFGLYVWNTHGDQRGLEYYTGYLVEKTLSVDNLFVFMLLLTAFAVPKALQQRVLLYGIVGALVLRGIFIALGAAALDRFDWAFLVFGAVLLLTGLKLLRGAMSGDDHAVDVNEMRIVRLTRRVMPVTDEYHGTRLVIRRRDQTAPAPRHTPPGEVDARGVERLVVRLMTRQITTIMWRGVPSQPIPSFVLVEGRRSTVPHGQTMQGRWQ